jgi:hypothetical protein
MSVLYGPNRVVELPVNGGAPDTANDATAKNVLGTVITYNGNKYMYVQFNNGSGNVAAVEHGVVHWKSLDPDSGTFVVTSDYTDALGGVNAVAGITGCVVTDLYYTWIQIAGVATALVHSSTVAGSKCIGSSTDNTFGYIAIGGALTDVLFGVALNAYDTATTAEVLLHNLEWGGKEG